MVRAPRRISRVLHRILGRTGQLLSPERLRRLESRRDLSERLLRELLELIDEREISRENGQRVLEDIFEPTEAGVECRVRLWVWELFLSEAAGELRQYEVGSDRE